MRIVNRRTLNQRRNLVYTLKEALLALAILGLLMLLIRQSRLIKSISGQNEVLKDALANSNEQYAKTKSQLDNLIELKASKTPSKEQIKTAIETVFKDKAGEALRVATCESHLRTDALNVNTNGSVDGGVFQLNSIHTKRFGLLALADPLENIKVAHQLYLEQSWLPWASSTKCHNLAGK